MKNERKKLRQLMSLNESVDAFDTNVELHTDIMSLSDLIFIMKSQWWIFKSYYWH